MPTTTVITVKRLEELEAKERAHDDYLAATRAISSRSAAVELEARGIRVRGAIPFTDAQNRGVYAHGYRDCLRDISQAIVDAGEERRMGQPRLPDAPAPRAHAVVVGG